MEPAVSVIMPTHNRARLLPQTLLALARQTVPPAEYELILVADGCRDNTAEVVRSTRVPYKVRLIEQPGQGAATARNRGAELAAAPLLLFLDDDMEASPTLIEGHWKMHALTPGGLVLGYFPILAAEAGDDPFAVDAKQWWDKRFADWAKPDYRFSFRDFCTGNISMSAAVFRNAGGFCEEFHSTGGEDWDLGVRIMKQGLRFQYAPEAASIHHGITDFDYALRRQRNEGYGHVILARRHPELFWCFKLHALSRLQCHRRIWRTMWEHQRTVDALMAPLKPICRLLLRMRRHAALQSLYRLVQGHWYWQGARKAFGTVDAWEKMMREAPGEAPDLREIDIDIAEDWDKLEDRLEPEPVDAVRLYFRGEWIGRIPPFAAAQRLSAIQVRNEIAWRYHGFLLQFLLDERSRSSRGSTTATAGAQP